MKLKIYPSMLIFAYLSLLIGAESSFETEYIEGKVIIKLSEGKNLSSIDGLNRNFGVYSIEKLVIGKASKIDREFGLDRIHRIHFPESLSVLDVVKRYESDPSVEYAQPDYIYRLWREPNDPCFIDSSQWNLTKMECPLGWDVQIGTTSVVIAV